MFLPRLPAVWLLSLALKSTLVHTNPSPRGQYVGQASASKIAGSVNTIKRIHVIVAAISLGAAGLSG